VRGRGDDPEVVATETPVPVAPPKPTDQFFPHGPRRAHESRRNTLLVALPPKRTEDTGEHGRVVPNVPAKTAVLCFVSSETENAVDDVAYIIPIVLLLFVKREDKPTIIGGTFREVIAHESC
jgi:hypothetical protein